MVNKQNNGSSSGSGDSKTYTKKQIHNALFIKLSKRTDFLKALITKALSKKELSMLDLTTLRPEPTVFSNDSFKERRADVAASVKLKGMSARVGIMFLLEHKSGKSNDAFLQVLGYQTNCYLEQGSKKKLKSMLYPYSVLVYHGKEKWDIPESFQDAYMKGLMPKDFVDTFGDSLLNFRCPSVNLRKMDVFEEFSDKFAMLACFVMKNIWHMDDNLYGDMLSLIRRHKLHKDKDVRDLLQYIAEHNPRYSDEDVILDIERKALKKEEVFMEPVLGIFNKETFKKGIEKGREEGIEKGIEQGLQKGREEGMQETAHEIVLKMLDKGLDTKAISSYTGLSEKDIESIKSKPKNGKIKN